MLINKIIEVGIDIQDPITFFNNTIPNLSKHLRANYVGKCFKQCLIIKIIKIIQHSDPVIDQSQNNSFAKLNIKFEVQGVVFLANDIITGCKVINIDRTGTFLCRAKYACVMIKANKYFQSITTGQLINAVVMDARYYPGNTQITIMAAHFTFDLSPKTYYIDEKKITAEQWNIINDIISILNKEEKKGTEVQQQNKKGWAYFSKLLYAYKTLDETPPKGAKKINIFKMPTGWISRDPKLNLTEPNAFIYKDPPQQLLVDPDVSDFDAYVAILYHYLNMRKTLRKMIMLYNTDELLKSHKNLWQIMQNSKLG